MGDKEKRLEDIRRSCLNCGHKHYNHDHCCDTPYCVSDLMKEKAETGSAKLARFVNWLHEYVKGDKLKIVYIHDNKQCTLGLSDSETNQVFLIGSSFDLGHVIKDTKQGEHYQKMKNILKI